MKHWLSFNTWFESKLRAIKASVQLQLGEKNNHRARNVFIIINTVRVDVKMFIIVVSIKCRCNQSPSVISYLSISNREKSLRECVHVPVHVALYKMRSLCEAGNSCLIWWIDNFLQLRITVSNKFAETSVNYASF